MGKNLRIIEASQPETHRNLLNSSGREISPTQRLPPDNIHSQRRDIHNSSLNRTRNSIKLAAANPRLRQGGHWDRPFRYSIANHKRNAGVHNHKLWITWLAKYLQNYLLFGWRSLILGRSWYPYVRQEAEPGPISEVTFQGIKWPEPETKRLVSTLGLHTSCLPHTHSLLNVEAQ